MKKLMILLSLGVVCSLCGCGQDREDTTQNYTVEEMTAEDSTQEDAKSEDADMTTEDVTDEQTEATTQATSEASTEMTTEQAEENDTESDEAYMNMYYEILDSIYQMICAGIDEYDYIDGTNGIGELIMSGDDNVLGQVGYTFEDVNEDGTVELIIGGIYEDDATNQSQTIYSVYTFQDTPHLLLEGWSRNRCFLLEDGTFFNEGSAGAIYKIFEHVKLEPDATEVSYIDYYFSYEKDASMEEIGYYHNEMGEWDPNVSEEMTEDAFWEKFAAYGEEVKTLTFYPFSSYEYTGEHED